MAGGQHAIGVAVAAIARQPHLLHPAERCAVLRASSAAGWWCRAPLPRGRRRAAPAARACRPARDSARPPPSPVKRSRDERLVHHAVDRPPAAGQRDQRAPGRHAGDEGLGAVDRIEQPDDIRRRDGRRRTPRRRCRGPGTASGSAPASPASAARSAAVTGSKRAAGALVLDAEAVRKNGRIVSPETVGKLVDEGREIDRASCIASRLPVPVAQ